MQISEGISIKTNVFFLAFFLKMINGLISRGYDFALKRNEKNTCVILNP
jgi:hypothetical protein